MTIEEFVRQDFLPQVGRSIDIWKETRGQKSPDVERNKCLNEDRDDMLRIKSGIYNSKESDWERKEEETVMDAMKKKKKNQ